MYINWNQSEMWNFSVKWELGRAYARQKWDPLTLTTVAHSNGAGDCAIHLTQGLLRDQRHLQTAGTPGSEAFQLGTKTKRKGPCRRQHTERHWCIESCCRFTSQKCCQQHSYSNHKVKREASGRPNSSVNAGVSLWGLQVSKMLLWE